MYQKFNDGTAMSLFFFPSRVPKTYRDAPKALKGPTMALIDQQRGSFGHTLEEVKQRLDTIGSLVATMYYVRHRCSNEYLVSSIEMALQELRSTEMSLAHWARVFDVKQSD
jgi:hypothetical protein